MIIFYNKLISKLTQLLYLKSKIFNEIEFDKASKFYFKFRINN